jgi:serpin B
MLWLTAMRPTLLLLSSTPLLVLLAGCGSAGTPSSQGPNTVTVDGQTVTVARAEDGRLAPSTVPSSALTGAVAANNAFAVDLYGQVRAQSVASNLLTSPISASLALTMTYAGARETTATQMAAALHYGSTASSIFEGQNALSQALASRATAALAADQKVAEEGQETPPSPSNYALQVVNSVWGQKTYSWEAPFLKILAEDYGTGVYLQDFVDDYNPARILINDWVSNETSGKIENLLPDGALDPSTRMVLVNAIHLKMPWATNFDASATAPASFTTASGGSVSTPFMNQTNTLPYVDDGQAQIVGLPLYNNQLSVVIALPHGDLATYEAGLTAQSAGIRMPGEFANVALSVPKVTFTSPTFSLKDSLLKLGMTQAFDPFAADFKGLCANPPDGDNLYIGDVLQKAMIAMQETGVEAAAATAVLVEGASVSEGPPPKPIPMVVNRPYVISIVDVPTGAVLFLGHIVDPTAGGAS